MYSTFNYRCTLWCSLCCQRASHSLFLECRPWWGARDRWCLAVLDGPPRHSRAPSFRLLSQQLRGCSRCVCRDLWSRAAGLKHGFERRASRAAHHAADRSQHVREEYSDARGDGCCAAREPGSARAVHPCHSSSGMPPPSCPEPSTASAWKDWHLCCFLQVRTGQASLCFREHVSGLQHTESWLLAGNCCDSRAVLAVVGSFCLTDRVLCGMAAPLSNTHPTHPCAMDAPALEFHRT